MTKRNAKGRIIGLLIVAFITTNALLIFFDEDENIDRKSYVNEWSKAITYDLYEKLNTTGVFTSEESTPVYFDKDIGSFQEFLVEEGEIVDTGDELYAYKVMDYYQEEAQLQREVSRLEEEIDAVEDYISEIESYQIPDPPESENDSFFDDSDTEEENPPSYVETKFRQEEKIAEQEAELAKQKAMLKMVEDQLDQLRDEGNQITVTSAFTGTVTHISESLEDPLLTLESSNLVLEGELSESARDDVEADMKAEVYAPELDLDLTGTISSVHSFPKNVDISRPSQYPFSITLEENDGDLLPGYHANVRIIAKEATNVVTALETALETEENLYAWVMDGEGQLDRRDIKTGLDENGLIEIASGLEEGEWLAVYPKDEFRHGATFFTPLQQQDLHIQELFSMDRTSMLTYGLLGLLSR